MTDDTLADLNRVLKYSRLRTQPEWSPIVQDHNERLNEQIWSRFATGDAYTDDNTSHKILADFLQDEGDPRAELLRNAPDHRPHDALHSEGYRIRQQAQSDGEHGSVAFDVYHHPQDPSRPKRLVLTMGFQDARPEWTGGIHRSVEVSPEQARPVVNALPDADRKAASDMIDQHFGAAQ